MTIDQQLLDAKRYGYERIAIDTESFQRRVLAKVRSSSDLSAQSINKKRKYAWFAIPTAVLLLSGFAYAATLRKGFTQTPTIAKAVNEAPFPIKLPTYVPLHPPMNKWGQVSYLGGNIPSNTDISLVWAGVWANGKRGSVTEDVVLTDGTINHKVNYVPKHPKSQQIVYLSNGKPAIFLQRSGSLFWNMGSETYRITLHPRNALPVSGLIRIADSVK